MSGSELMLVGGVPAVAANYIEDVFSTYLYTGTAATQTITNNIDLSGKGGLVWLKGRDRVDNHYLFDTARGANKDLNSNDTSAQFEDSPAVLSAFTSTGFTLGSNSSGNAAAPFVSWTFRKAEKFFDVVTYTGTGSARTISHNLGSTPGCIIVKRTDTTGAWQVYHRANTAAPETDYLVLNTTAATADSDTRWNDTLPTSTVFSLGTDATVNANGGTYVAYLFAHDAGGFGTAGTDNVISCGSFTTDGSGNATVSLGYEPQWVLYKRSSGTGNWFLQDNMRGFVAGTSTTGNATLFPNQSWAESANYGDAHPSATGFTISASDASSTFIYIAIRRGPMKTPTDATKVFVPTVYTGTNVDNRLLDTTIAPDMVWIRQRDDTVLGGMVVGDRLRAQPYLLTGTTAAEVDDADAFDKQLVSTTEYGTAFSSMSGVWIGNDATAKLNVNTTSNNHIVEAFKRAPSFFDEVCYTGNGVSGRNIDHNLGVAPEIVIIKSRNRVDDWVVRSSAFPSGGVNDIAYLNYDMAASGAGYSYAPTATTFQVENNNNQNGSTYTYVAYLFASLSGVSKVGSYTGTGTTKQVDCGFTNGSRFVLIKRTDSTGDWYVWDSARGIVAGDDPYLLLNSSAAEVTNTDYVDTYSAGFELSSTAPAGLNANGGSYIFLAIA